MYCVRYRVTDVQKVVSCYLYFFVYYMINTVLTNKYDIAVNPLWVH